MLWRLANIAICEVLSRRYEANWEIILPIFSMGGKEVIEAEKQLDN